MSGVQGSRDAQQRGAGGRRPLQQVWLPGSGVWAAVPAQAPPSASRKRHGSPERDRRRAAPPTAAPPPPPPPPETAAAHITGFELQHSEYEASDVEEADAPPTCPICLTDIIELSEKAVVTTCMHVFCHGCISRWLERHKRTCPLCKARVTSVLYDIAPSGTHKEREVPPSPKLVTAGSGEGGAADGLPLLQRLQDFLGVAGLLDPFEQHQQQQRGGRLRSEAGSGSVGYGTGGSSRGRQGASGRSHLQGGTAAAGGAAGGSSQQGPRPYFWRLQQRLQAGAYRPGGQGEHAGGEGGEGPVSQEDYVLLWRRQIYDQDLWAVPLGSEPAAISLGSGSARERRLTEWVDRELRALLGTDDTTVVRGFVMGLLVAYGLEPFDAASTANAAGGGSGAPGSRRPGSSSRPAAAATAAAVSAVTTARRRAAQMVAAAAGANAGGRGGGGSRGSPGAAAGPSGPPALSSSPQEALRPFLHEHAEHFWHELRCFATAPYTIPTYDRMVSYLRRQPEPAAAAAAGGSAAGPAGGAAAAAAGGGGRERGSRWNRQPSAQQRQQQWGNRAVQPARVVSLAGPVQQLAQQQQQAGSRPPADDDVWRRGGTASGSRNPSPPPLPARGHAAAAAQKIAAAAGPAVGSRQEQQSMRLRRHRSRSSSREDRRRSRRGRRRPADRSRSRSRSPIRRHRRRRSRSSGRRERERAHHSPVRRYSREGAASPELYNRPGRQAYLVGDDDGGDRWGME